MDFSLLLQSIGLGFMFVGIIYIIIVLISIISTKWKLCFMAIVIGILIYLIQITGK